MVYRRLRTRRTLGLIALSVVLGLSALPIGLGSWHAGPANLPIAASPLRTGANELALAQRSLASGAGPASAHASAPMPSVALPPSPSLRWSNLSSLVTNAPTGRITEMGWDASDGYVVLFGGARVGGFDGDTWTYSNGTWTNVTSRLTGPSPPALVGGGMAFDPSSATLILFGGENSSGARLAQTWSYHALAWTNLTSQVGTSPPPRIFPAMATDSTDQAVLLVGGELPTGLARDTWSFHNGAWVNITSAAPISATLYLPMISDDPVDHGVLMFSTMLWNGSRFVPGTWLFSGGLTGGSWRNETSLLGPAQPPNLYYGNMAYDPALSAVFLLAPIRLNSTGGGAVGAQLWMYEAGAWSNQSRSIGTPPVTTIIAGAAWVGTDNLWLVFGGESISGGPILPVVTMALAAPPTAQASVSRSVIDAGMSVAFTGSFTNGTSPDTVGWTFGDGGTATSLSPSHSYASAGLFTATLTVTSFVGASSSRTVSVYVNLALAVSTSGTPDTATAGQNTTFAAAVTGGTGPLTYAWSFGDNATSSSVLAVHDYARAGTYTLNLTVTDALGQKATGSVHVVVAAKAAAPSGNVDVTSGTGLGLLLVIVVLLILAAVLGALWMMARKPKMAPAPMPFQPGPPMPPPPPPAAPPKT